MSCCNCLKIQVLDDVPGVVPVMKTDGKIYLDLPQDFSLEFFKSVEQFAINTIDTEAVIEASIPQTNLNRALAYQIENKNKAGDVTSGYNVLITEGAITHRFSKMYFVGGGDSARSYNVVFELADNHWLNAAGQKYLNEFDFGSYRFTVDNFNTFNSRSGYVDGEEGIVFPMVNYGSWIETDGAVLEDFRQFIFVTKVLDDGFQQLGWNFESPYFKSTAGRKLITYINSKEYNSNPFLLESRRFSATLDDRFYFTSEVFDNGDNFEDGKYIGQGTHEFIVEISGDLRYDLERPQLPSVFIENKNGETRYVNIIYEGRFRATASGEFTLSPGDYVRAGIDGDISGIYIDNAVFYNKPKAGTPARGEQVNVAQYFGKYTFLDFIKGCAHIINAKVVTDWVNRTVTLYCPYDVEYYDESIEGFYTDTISDWTDKIIPDSEEISKRDIDLQRYQVFAFKISTDSHIKELNLEEDLPLFAKRLDLGEDYKPEEEKNENPFFEPTYNDKLVNFDFSSPLATNLPVDVPFMLDNQDDKLSFDIKPRILFWNGQSKQTSDDGATTRYWKFEVALQQDVPYAFQKAGSYVDDGVEIKPPDLQLTFEDHDNSLYNLFYERWFNEQIFTSTHGFLAKIGSFEYNNTDFRNAYKAFYGGRTFVFNLLSIDGRRTCSNAPVQITARPRAYAGDVCGTNITSYVVNEAQIRIKYDFENESITAESVNTAIILPIVTDVFQVSTDGGQTFTPYTEGTPITGEEDLIFIRDVVFSDGSESTAEAVATLETFCSNEVDVLIDYNKEAGTASAIADDELNSTIDTDTWTVEIDGATAVNYTQGTELSGFATLFFERVVTFADHCDPVTIQKSVQVDVETCVNRPVLNWVELSDGLFVFEIDETNVQSSLVFSDIQVYNPATEVWRAWNGSPFRGMPGTIARARIIYADGCPPSNIESICPTTGT